MAGTSIALGIDVGGSGIKGAPVDLDRGDFAAERIRIETPAVSSPLAVCEVIAEIVERFDGAHGHAPIGVTIPGVVTTAWSAPPPTSTRSGSASTQRGTCT